MNRQALAQWLDRYQGHEIILDSVLDQLGEFGVRYSHVEARLYDGTRTVPLDVMSYEQLRAKFSEAPGVRAQFTPGTWQGVATLDLARALCQLAQLGDPALVLRGTLTRYRAYVTTLREGQRP